MSVENNLIGSRDFFGLFSYSSFFAIFIATLFIVGVNFYDFNDEKDNEKTYIVREEVIKPGK